MICENYTPNGVVVVDVVVANAATIVMVVEEDKYVFVENIMCQKYNFLGIKKAFLKFLIIIQ